MIDETRLWDDSDPRDGMLSVTQLHNFDGCRRRWAYGYLEGLHPRRERSYLTVGRLIHAGFEAAMLRHAEGSESVSDMVGAGLAAMEEDARACAVEFDGDEVDAVGDELGVARDVFSEALPEFDPTRWDVVAVDGVPAVELHFVCPCPPAVGMHGFIDAVLRERSTGQVWCVDYKFRSRLTDEDEERYSLQRAVYARVMRDMGVPVVGTLTWQRVRRPQAKPRVLRDGSMSRSKIMCTWAAYRDAVLAAGLDPEDYTEMRDKLSRVEMHRETRELRSDEYLDRVWRGVVVPTASMLERAKSGDGSVPINPSMDPWRCRQCHFSELCQAELRGYDVDSIRESGFVKAEWARQ